MSMIVPTHILFTAIKVVFEYSIFTLLCGYVRYFRHILKHLLINVFAAFPLQHLLPLFHSEETAVTNFVK